MSSHHPARRFGGLLLAVALASALHAAEPAMDAPPKSPAAVPPVPAPAAPAAAPAPTAAPTTFDERVARTFAVLRGQPLKRAAKQPPLAPGRGNYVRGYSFSIVEFATRCLVLDEQIAAANAALTENAQHYADNPADINDRDSFHWHAEMLCRLIEHYGRQGSVAAGRVTPATEDAMLDVLWRYAVQFSLPARFEAEQSRTWHVYESENHHLQGLTACWHVAKLAAASPAYRDRRYPDGGTPAAHLAAWTAYIKLYCLERARKGLFIEVGSDGYNTVGLKGLYNVYDFAADAELRRRVGLLLDLFWATWAQTQLDGVRGGGKARIYQTGNDRQGASDLRQLGWYYFGVGEGGRLSSPMLAALTSGYRPPALVADLARDPAARGRYAIHTRVPGRAAAGFEKPPDYHVLPDASGIHAYSWCTPSFILGTLMLEARPMEDWTRGLRCSEKCG